MCRESNNTITFDLKGQILGCWKWSKIDICKVRYCVSWYMHSEVLCQLICIGTMWELTLDFNGFSLQQWVFNTKICRKLPMSYQLQLSSRVPMSMDLLSFFVNMGPYGSKKNQMTSPLKAHIRFTRKNHTFCWGWGLYQRCSKKCEISNFGYLIFVFSSFR